MIARKEIQLTQNRNSTATFRLVDVVIKHRRRVIVEGLSCSLQRGETLMVYGPARSGKSTLLLVGAGLVKPQSGKSLVLGESPSSRWGKAQTGIMGPLQNPYPFLTLRENALLEAKLRQLGESRVDTFFQDFGISRYGGLRPHQVSEEVRTLARIASASLHHPAVLFLDEPTSTLGDEVSEIWKVLDKLKSDGMAVVATTRHRHECSHGDQVIELPWEDNR